MKKILSLFLIFAVAIQGAQFFVSDKDETKHNANWAVIPYVFDAESTGFTGGVAAILLFHQ